MQFNSYEFLIFFVLVYAIYLKLAHRWQNRLLLLASYVFYGWWDWRFLSLIFASTVVDFVCGLKIDSSVNQRHRRIYLAASICTNLGILGFFKYYNFFTENLQGLLSGFGLGADALFLDIILPVGISFYTFQTMSYTIDIYKREMKPTDRFLDFALFVAFFPQLVAGPIERARTLIPQVLGKRTITKTQVTEGCHLILLGLFEKLLIADNCARIVDSVFSNAAGASSGTALIGTYAFAFQILADFSGYSNIARGLAKLLGFELMLNFNLPYFATNPSDFWRRWHISLSTWFRDYLYIPLGGSRIGRMRTYLNLMLTMLLAGLWHGAAWKFVLWGGYMGGLMAAHRALRPALDRLRLDVGPTGIPWRLIRTVVTFNLICIGWLIFRAESVSQAWQLFSTMLSGLQFDPMAIGYAKELIGYIWLLVLIQFIQYFSRKMDFYMMIPAYSRALYLSSVLYLLVFYGTSTEAFIYFQF